MNLHGYKLKAKTMKRLIDKEKVKKNPSELKINRLERAKKNCKRKIRELRLEKKKNVKIK